MNLHGNPASAGRLPVWRLLAFTMAGFLAIMTETMPAGLLPQISAGLEISETLAGQLVTLYALGSVLAAIPVIAATRSWKRRPLFLTAIAGLLAFNSITAISTHYELILAARFAAGMAAGVVWGLVAGYARRIVPQRLQGRALAVAGLGQPIALCLGVPLGTWLGMLFDWRGVFWIMSAVALLLFAWVRLAVPDFEGQTARQRLPLRRIATTPGIRPVLLALFAWILAHNILYTYIAPFLASAGLGHRVDAVLLLFGVASIAGIWITGALVDRWLRALTLLSLTAFAVAALVLGLSGGSPAAVLLGIAVWGLTFGGAPTLLQTALADTAGDGTDVAQSMLVTVFNLAVAGGGALGGVLLEHIGPAALPWALVMLALLGTTVVWSARTHGFRTGHRIAAS
ncbi:major facilitator superfamily protein 56 (plasmid) [Achromobacter xylosoxidans A8]|uniref:Major facilitator superfamily protein 56 n=1 Tax=Achromobacter xylosoxidans (strain A8) TaxID=762376 RepID=E3HY40_ACHXA|nr:MFS transporter [Achromobacter xylosoxidans]ADP19994.1 major facilitator superfamily protein 56 [Achromobacter xylosoxidans A8]